ncbi:unnamed protein product [Schistocephalus solidus]|uniref:Uncharacterized protein n=1 Tax=Schistocephalus solidus TaxID=70667 RepID=A0A183T4I6_SCHSO|nr:unnamed protein product [Schistocephalus solidus]
MRDRGVGLALHATKFVAEISTPLNFLQGDRNINVEQASSITHTSFTPLFVKTTGCTVSAMGVVDILPVSVSGTSESGISIFSLVPSIVLASSGREEVVRCVLTKCRAQMYRDVMDLLASRTKESCNPTLCAKFMVLLRVEIAVLAPGALSCA